MNTEGGSVTRIGGKGDFGDDLVLAALNIQKEAEKMKKMTMRQQEEVLAKKLEEHRIAVKEHHEWQVSPYTMIFTPYSPHNLYPHNL